MKKKTAIIIGAGPAGLTAAYELVTRTDIQPIVLEKSEFMGGISRTINYKGYRMDLGGHRFFSKSDRVMNWWFSILPAENFEGEANLKHQGKEKEISYSKKMKIRNPDCIMLVRPRKSRIYYTRKFFDYPLQLNAETLKKLGLVKTLRIGSSYMKSSLFPIRPEENLEQFFINRFGRELYLTFFKSYTEKVWGVPCDKISAEWGAQRVKGVSVRKALSSAIEKTFKKNDGVSLSQKETETSLIEKFLYPKYGPGQMWEEVARIVQSKGGKIITNSNVTEIDVSKEIVSGVTYENSKTKKKNRIRGDYIFSTMPIKELVEIIKTQVPAEVREIAEGLQYRDFLTVGLLLDKILLKEPDGGFIKDTWIYIQEPDVLMGRLQIFNNWSPHLVKDPSKVWVGLEYFCYKGDDLWNKKDEDMAKFAIGELAKIGIINQPDVLDWHVERMEKTYPAYFGAYARFSEVQNFLDGFPNLFLIGRNGMHKYNNQDHSMLTAMTAVDNIIKNIKTKENIWGINTEEEYHEEKKS